MWLFIENHFGAVCRRLPSVAEGPSSVSTNEFLLLDDGGFWIFLAPLLLLTMQNRTRISLAGFLVLVIAAIVILLLNLKSIEPAQREEQCVQLNGSSSCHFSNPSPHRFYNTKTTYNVAAEDAPQSDLPVDDCSPKVFYFLSRHGIRYPDAEYIVDFINRLPLLRSKIIQSSVDGKAKLCEKDIKSLREWSVKMTPEDDNKLAEAGEKETEELGYRLKFRFSSILNQKYSPEKFTIEYTSRSRTRSTAEAFAKGLFGEEYSQIDFDDKENDAVLTFHRACKKFQKKCGFPGYDTSEIEKFQNGTLMKKLVDSVSNRVGFELSVEDIKLIQLACVFGYALNDSDAWCSLFTNEESEVLEFGEDVDDYYKDGYGNKVNYEQACPIGKHIVNLFEAGEKSPESKVVLHFSHAGGIKKAFSFFGLFRDEFPLKADGFCYQKNRKWRSSLISPFSSNLALILYQCGSEHKVAAYHNEKPVQIGGCSDLFCPFDQFLQFYSQMTQSCNLRKVCCTCCKH